MAMLTPTLEDHDYQNWVKGGLSLKYARDGIEKFVERNSEDFHQDVMNNSPAGANSCSSCSTENTVQCMKNNNFCKIVNGNCKVHDMRDQTKKSKRRCPNSVCDKIYTAIIQEHRFNGPMWKNTDSQLWCKDHWQLAKCFMPHGYASPRTVADTDFSDLLSVVINDKRFAKQVSENLSSSKNIFCQARDVRNKILHKADMKLTDKELEDYIGVLDAMLSDAKYLATYADAITAKTKLDKVLKGEIKITAEDLRNLQTLRALERKEVLANIESALNDAQNILKSEKEAVSQNSYDKIKKDFKFELMSVYHNDEQLSAPLFPLAPMYKKNIDVMYVQPNMTCDGYINIEGYEDIFKDKGEKNYVVGDAGLGKTSLCQKIISTWCHIQSGTIETMAQDQQAIAQFEFLFYISLRQANTEDFNDTHIEDMIKHQLLSKELHEHLPTVLKNEKCLVILDGLDEWSLEHKTARLVNRGIPGRQAMHNCTVLTTTRPWKLEAIQLDSTQIDKKLELLGITQPSSDHLIQIMLQHLNKRNNTNKQMVNFKAELENKHLDQFMTIPVMLKQLVCLWYAGKPLGPTKCSIYSQMMELLLELAKTRLKQDTKYQDRKDEGASSSIELPPCFKGNDACQEYKPLLVGLGGVAFHTLLNKNQESSLVFKRSQAEIHGMKPADINMCLCIGILSQSGFIQDARSHRKLSFLHKTYQEFLAALYASTIIDETEEHEECIQRINQTCNSEKTCLQMENIIIFISGMASTTTTCRLIAHVNPLIDIYHLNIRDISMQKYITNCLQEGWYCSHKNQHLKCGSIILQSYVDIPEHMELLCKNNIHQMKLLWIQSRPTTRCLEYLMQVENLERLLISSYLVISEDNMYSIIKHNTNELINIFMEDMTFRSKTQLPTLLHGKPYLSRLSLQRSTM